MNTGVFIIVRLGSSRLPKKNIMEILGKPMIELLIERIKQSKLIDKIVITTSSDSIDDPLEDLAEKLGVFCYRGALENVMERINGAAHAFDCDTIVELLGDNPLVHAELIDDVLGLYQNGNYDYAATVTKEYPLFDTEKKLFSVGVRVQVYSRSSAERYVKYPDYIENDSKHPCSYIFDHPDTFKIGYLEAKGKWAFMNRPDLTFAVNYRKNFNLVRSIFERNYPEDKNIPLEKVYQQLDEEKYLYLLMGSE